jgi:hypothetical protein
MKNLNFEYESADTNDVSFKTLRTIKNLGLKVIKVPLRMEGLSSKGDEDLCHQNVNKMVIRYGGEILVGQYLLEIDEGIILTNHSVWITPERKVACISKANCVVDGGISDECFKKFLEQGYILFVPRRVTKGFRGYETLPSHIYIKGNRIASDTADRYLTKMEEHPLKNAHKVIHQVINIGVLPLETGSFLRDYKRVA